jgi:hypothetical protein
MSHGDYARAACTVQESKQIIAQRIPVVEVFRPGTRPEWAEQHPKDVVMGLQKIQEGVVASRRVPVSMQKVERLAAAAVIDGRDRSPCSNLA